MPRKAFAMSAALLGMGLLTFTPTAAWGEDDDESSVISVHDNVVGVQACHNHVPVNVLGVQVPINDVAASVGVPILSDDSPEEGRPGQPDECDQDTVGRGNEGSVGRDGNEPASGGPSEGRHGGGGDDRDEDEGKRSDLLPFL